LLQLGNGAHQVVLITQVLEPVRHRHTRLPEHLPATTFRAQPIQNRIAGVERYIQPHGEGPLERRAIETGHVSSPGIRDGRADTLQQTRSFEYLLCQGRVGGVVAAQKRQPPSGLANWYAREEM